MAARRRGKKQQRRRRQTGISLVSTAEALLLANAATQTFFNTNAVEFVMGNQSNMTAKGMNALSIRELFSSTQSGVVSQGIKGTPLPVTGNTFAIIQENLANNWIEGTIKMTTIPLAFKLGKRLGAPAINKINGVLRKAGIAQTVRI
jgi:hypothetical protein